MSSIKAGENNNLVPAQPKTTDEGTPENNKTLEVHDATEKTTDLSPKNVETEHKEEVLTGNLAQKAAQAMKLLQEKQANNLFDNVGVPALVGGAGGGLYGALTAPKNQLLKSVLRGATIGGVGGAGMGAAAMPLQRIMSDTRGPGGDPHAGFHDGYDAGATTGIGASGAGLLSGALAKRVLDEYAPMTEEKKDKKKEEKSAASNKQAGFGLFGNVGPLQRLFSRHDAGLHAAAFGTGGAGLGALIGAIQSEKGKKMRGAVRGGVIGGGAGLGAWGAGAMTHAHMHPRVLNHQWPTFAGAGLGALVGGAAGAGLHDGPDADNNNSDDDEEKAAASAKQAMDPSTPAADPMAAIRAQRVAQAKADAAKLRSASGTPGAMGNGANGSHQWSGRVMPGGASTGTYTPPAGTAQPAAPAAAMPKPAMPAPKPMVPGMKAAANFDMNALMAGLKNVAKPATYGAMGGAALGGLAGLLAPGRDENGNTRGRFGAAMRGALGGGALGGLGGAAMGHYAKPATEKIMSGISQAGNQIQQQGAKFYKNMQQTQLPSSVTAWGAG